MSKLTEKIRVRLEVIQELRRALPEYSAISANSTRDLSHILNLSGEDSNNFIILIMKVESFLKTLEK